METTKLSAMVHFAVRWNNSAVYFLPLHITLTAKWENSKDYHKIASVRWFFSGENALTLSNLSWLESYGLVHFKYLGDDEVQRRKIRFPIPSGFPSLQATFSPVLLSTENDKGEWSLATS